MQFKLQNTLWLALLAAILVPQSAMSMSPSPTAGQAPVSVTCPASVAKIAKCHAAYEANGNIVLMAVPRQWNRGLIVHAHGGPSLDPPKLEDAAEDLDRFSVFVRQGYAWTGATYRRGGYGVRMAAEDVDNSRIAFGLAFGKPDRTLLHGQSYGGNVAAKAAELYALSVEGVPNYDGVLLTNGVLAGGTRAYGFRAELRAVYQYYCNNHPSSDEKAYPLWQGLPLDSRLTRKGLRDRINDCTGLELAPDARTASQSRKLKSILSVTGIAEKQLVSHMTWATFTFQDLVLKRLGGLNPFDNSQTVYHGSGDDKALNAGIARFRADPKALARLGYDADLSGQIVLPTVTVHALRDPVIPFAFQADYARVVRHAGRDSLLVQTATDEDSHSRLAETQYIALIQALEDWIREGTRPDPSTISKRCQKLLSDVPGGCHFVLSQ